MIVKRPGWGGGHLSLLDLFPITKSRHTNMWFTRVNVHVTKGKITSVVAEYLNTTLAGITYHIQYDNSPVIRASGIKSK